jgi:peptidoglycan/xylan/chitin deacetylase (PgdA/CDA1 family)
VPTATYPPPPEELHVPILMYHYISDVPPDADRYRIDLTVPIDRFEEQLSYLKTQGYTTVYLKDIYDTLSIGKPLPENPIVLTFDDGYKDAYTNVLPMLQTYEFVAEFFILATPAHYEASHYLSWNDVRIMADNGMSMQAHGRDHYDLTNRPYDFLVYQILGAKEAVEAHSAKDVSFFCYPSGRYDDDTQAVVASAGYLGAVTTEWGALQRLDNRYTWPRIRIKGAWTLDTFASIMTGLREE